MRGRGPCKGRCCSGSSFDPSHPYAGGQHRGIDIGAATGTAVGAPASGTVSFAGAVPTSGKSVTIATPDGYSVTLTHLGSIEVVQGAAVGEGAEVGTVGPSGTPELDVPYLYMGVRVTANAQGYLDPLSFLPALPPPVASSPTPPPATAPAPRRRPRRRRRRRPRLRRRMRQPLRPTRRRTRRARRRAAPATFRTRGAPPPDTTAPSAEAPAPDAAAAPPDPTPDATSAPTSGAGDVSAPADAPPPDTTTPSADAPPPDAAAAPPDPTPDATSTPTSGAGDISAPAAASPPDTSSDAPAPPPTGDAGATDSTPAPTPAPAPPHATVLNPDPGFDPTADDAPPDSAAGDAPGSPIAAEPVTVAVADDVAADDAFRVHVAVPAVMAIAPFAPLQRRAPAPAIPSVHAPRRRPVPFAVHRVSRRVPVVVPAPRRHPAVPLPAATRPVVAPARRSRTPWPLYVLSALACAAGVGAVRMISNSSKTSEGAHPVAVAEDPRRRRVALRERPAASGPCRRPRRALRHLRALPPAEGQRRPHGERDGRARHAGDGLGRSRGRVAP